MSSNDNNTILQSKNRQCRIRKCVMVLAAVGIPFCRVNCYTSPLGPSTHTTTPTRKHYLSSKLLLPNSCPHCKTTTTTTLGRNLPSTRISSVIMATTTNNNNDDDDKDKMTKLSNLNQVKNKESNNNNNIDSSRRHAIQSLLAAGASVAAFPTLPAFAGKPEVDPSGILYTPKTEMLSGGSSAARGIPLESRAQQVRLQPGQAFQTVYETRFIAYLSRFLLNFDPTVNAWWVQNVGSADDTWDLMATITPDRRKQLDAKFAEFAESVEIGLADYFVGPYGSYSSLSAMKAGVEAKMPAKSARNDDPPSGFFGTIREDFFLKKEKKELRDKNRDKLSKQGVLNLYTLLKARYTSTNAKRQLAILFSFFSNPNLQPTAEISSLLGEADNASVSEIDIVKPMANNAEATSRSSCRRGGGYSVFDSPTITIDSPPALGSSYRAATAEPIMQPTSRVLRIKVTDGGNGYTTVPDVFVEQGAQRQCVACAIVDREGRVESVLVLDPGYGYAKRKLEPPKVTIAPPDSKGQNTKESTSRRATAIAELEYEIVGIKITEAGNGYIATDPPKVTISPPLEDPDWYVDSTELAVLESEFGPFRAEVSQMRGPSGNLAYSLGGTRKTPLKIALDRIRKDPLELLPSFVRPEINSYGVYVIPPIAAIATYSTSPNPRYRAVDPLFGAIGKVPVTKSAVELKPSEYGRLALSGAVCTVLVRTALNPLELIKTKQQLQNDEELISFTRDKMREKAAATMNSTTPSSDESGGVATLSIKEEKIGTTDLISSLIELRGPFALFQSADITFLASLVFGSFGFGATELFRRSFSQVFFSEGGGTELGSEFVLLLAATVATVITSSAAAPFELLRVRSMGLVEPKSWTNVLGDFIKEKAANGDNNNSNGGGTLSRFGNFTESGSSSHNHDDDEVTDFDLLKDIKPKDLLPLWAGFLPTASRELAFAIPKFLAFDILAKTITGFINAQAEPGSLPIQVGVGSAGLFISAISGAIAGLAGAFVSHPADLILTYTSASKKKKSQSGDGSDTGADWKAVVKELLSREGGITNLYIGLTPRLVFFFLVIGLQFFLYDYVKNLLQVGSDDLSLVLDVFYAVRRGLVEMTDGLS